MKTFVCALCVFALLIAMIVCNAIYINKTATVMEEKIYALPSYDKAGDAIGELINLWEKRRVMISVSVSFELIENVNDRLSELQSAALSGEESEYEKSRKLLLNAISQINRLEQFSIENLF